MDDRADTGLIMKALAFAAAKHRDQRRKDVVASPYINHPIQLADVLVNEGGVTDAEVLAAAILHDTIEDTETTPAELAADFGPAIRDIVLEVTDDKSLAKPVRKQRQIDHAPHLSDAARLVKLADKICNLRDVADHPPAGWGLERRQAYFDWARAVIDGLRGSHPRLEAVFDATYALRPTRPPLDPAGREHLIGQLQRAGRIVANGFIADACRFNELYHDDEHDCRVCDAGGDCRWLSVVRSRPEMAARPDASLYDLLGYAVDYCMAMAVMLDHEIERCDCDMCDWTRAARALYAAPTDLAPEP